MKLVEPVDGRPRAAPGRPVRVPTAYSGVERPASSLLESADGARAGAEAGGSPGSDVAQSTNLSPESTPDVSPASGASASPVSSSPVSTVAGTSSQARLVETAAPASGGGTPTPSVKGAASETAEAWQSGKSQRPGGGAASSTQRAEATGNDAAQAVDDTNCVESTAGQGAGTAPTASERSASSAQSAPQPRSGRSTSSRAPRSQRRKRKRRKRGGAKKRRGQGTSPGSSAASGPGS